MGWLILLLVLGFLIWGVSEAQKRSKLQKAENETFMASHRGWDIYVSPFDRSVLALNHERKLIVLGKVDSYKQYAWAAVATVEVLRDGGSITSTNRGSQLMGAAAGGLLFGGVGALVGGLSGSKRMSSTINEMAIKVIVDDRTNPVYTIPFLQAPGSGLDPRNIMVKQVLSKVEHFHALLVNAVRSAHALAQPAAQTALPLSTGEQLAQLWSLKEAGALTDAEFAQQKATLLASR